ncbi:unnamed protein product [Choristocarpus tenellus]
MTAAPKCQNDTVVDSLSKVWADAHAFRTGGRGGRPLREDITALKEENNFLLQENDRLSKNVVTLEVENETLKARLSRFQVTQGCNDTQLSRTFIRDPAGRASSSRDREKSKCPVETQSLDEAHTTPVATTTDPPPMLDLPSVLASHGRPSGVPPPIPVVTVPQVRQQQSRLSCLQDTQNCNDVQLSETTMRNTAEAAFSQTDVCEPNRPAVTKSLAQIETTTLVTTADHPQVLDLPPNLAYPVAPVRVPPPVVSPPIAVVTTPPEFNVAHSAVSHEVPPTDLASETPAEKQVPRNEMACSKPCSELQDDEGCTLKDAVCSVLQPPADSSASSEEPEIAKDRVRHLLYCDWCNVNTGRSMVGFCTNCPRTVCLQCYNKTWGKAPVEVCVCVGEGVYQEDESQDLNVCISIIPVEGKLGVSSISQRGVSSSDQVTTNIPEFTQEFKHLLECL